MKNKSFIKQVREFAIANMGREASHDFSHALRVGNLARKIAISEGLERPVLYEVAGLLHDIGLGLCERKDHGEKGAVMAEEFLLQFTQSEISREEISEIVYAISWHNRKNSAPTRSQILDVLADADTLDLLGAIGIWRGLAARPEKELVLDAEAFAQKIDNAHYDSQQKEKRENNTHDLAEQLGFQISCADILTTRTAVVHAQPLLQMMKNFRFILVNQLTIHNYD